MTDENKAVERVEAAVTAPLCTVRVNRGNSRWSNFQDCGRPAVEDGLCKLHLRVRENRRAKDRILYEKNQREAALHAEAAALSAKLGIEVRADFNPYVSGGTYTGHFIVPGDWLRAQA